MTTGAAATSRFVRKYTAAATQNNTTPTKNTRRPSRSRSRNARTIPRALVADPAATLDDLQEGVTTFEEILRIARRVLGGAHPFTTLTEDDLRKSRAVLRARDAAPSGSA